MKILNFEKKRGDPSLFSSGWAGLSSECSGMVRNTKYIPYAFQNIQKYWYMIINKKVIIFLESGIFFFSRNLVKLRIWRPCARNWWVGSPRPTF